MIGEFAPIIHFIAVRLAARLPSHVELDDLISAGAVGLIDAIEKFDPGKEARLKTYAEIRIRGAMLDELRGRDWAPRSARKKRASIEAARAAIEAKLKRAPTETELAGEMGISLENFHQTARESAARSIVSIEDLKNSNNESIRPDLMEIIGGSKKNDPENILRGEETRQTLIDALDELPGNERALIELYYYEELTMKEIGAIMSISESRVSQLRSKCLRRLKTKLKGKISRLDEVPKIEPDAPSENFGLD